MKDTVRQTERDRDRKTDREKVWVNVKKKINHIQEGAVVFCQNNHIDSTRVRLDETRFSLLYLQKYDQHAAQCSERKLDHVAVVGT